MTNPAAYALIRQLTDALEGLKSDSEISKETWNSYGLSELLSECETLTDCEHASAPTDEELNELKNKGGQIFNYAEDYYGGNTAYITPGQFRAIARAALSRWGSYAPKPIPVSEQLPGPEHCCGNPRNGEGLWCWGREIPRTAAGTPFVWRLMPIECLPYEAVDWLPYWALPLPKLPVEKP